MATFKGNEFFSYDLSHTPIQSSTDEITLAFRTLQRNGLLLHTGKSVDYVNLSLKSGAVYLVINLGSGAFEAMVSPAEGKFNDNAWHEVRVSRNLRQVSASGPPGARLKNDCQIQRVGREGWVGEERDGEKKRRGGVTGMRLSLESFLACFDSISLKSHSYLSEITEKSLPN